LARDKLGHGGSWAKGLRPASLRNATTTQYRDQTPRRAGALQRRLPKAAPRRRRGLFLVHESNYALSPARGTVTGQIVITTFKIPTPPHRNCGSARAAAETVQPFTYDFKKGINPISLGEEPTGRKFHHSRNVTPAQTTRSRSARRGGNFSIASRKPAAVRERNGHPSMRQFSGTVKEARRHHLAL